MSEIYFLPFTFGAAIYSLAAVFLLMLSGVVSSAEVAYFSLSKEAIRTIYANDTVQNARVRKLIDQQHRLLATILVSNNFINVTVILLFAHISARLVDFSTLPFVGFVILAFFVTFFLLLFGEILPKIFASQHAYHVCTKFAPILLFLTILFAPIVRLLLQSTNIVNNRLNKFQHQKITKEELSQALEMAADGSIEEKEMLEGIIRFGDKKVVDVMTSRLDIVDIDIKLNYKDVLSKIVQAGFSRMPVYAKTRDSIKGVLYAKDLLPHLDKPANFRWQTLVRPAYFVPETKMIDDLLNDFQQSKVHMAIVVDEYGGTSGIITLEDILEEIVGEIADEYDTDEQLYTKENNYTFVFDAKILLNDFFKVEGVDDADFSNISSEVETLAGLILELKGEMPAKNEKLQFAHYVFEVVAVDNRRIKKVRLHIKSNSIED